MKTSEFITKVLNNFKRYKWIKGRYDDPLASPNGGCCLMGMAAKAQGGTNRLEAQKLEMFKLIRYVAQTDSIPVWNDREHRTRQDVIQAVKHARDLAIKQEESNG